MFCVPLVNVFYVSGSRALRFRYSLTINQVKSDRSAMRLQTKHWWKQFWFYRMKTSFYRFSFGFRFIDWLLFFGFYNPSKIFLRPFCVFHSLLYPDPYPFKFVPFISIPPPPVYVHTRSPLSTIHWSFSSLWKKPLLFTFFKDLI